MKLKEIKRKIDNLYEIYGDELEIKFSNKPVKLNFRLKEPDNGDLFIDLQIDNCVE